MPPEAQRDDWLRTAWPNAGPFVGAAVNFWAAPVVRSLLYWGDARDPATLIGAAGVLVEVATLAGWLPAWRASQIDPAKVLRES